MKQLETKKYNVYVQLEFHAKEWFVQRRVNEFFQRKILDAGHKAQQFFQLWILVVQSMVAQQVLEFCWMWVKVYVEFFGVFSTGSGWERLDWIP